MIDRCLVPVIKMYVTLSKSVFSESIVNTEDMCLDSFLSLSKPGSEAPLDAQVHV
jgi:hypothetical protein